MMESELSINAIVSPELLPSPYSARNESAEDKEARQSSMCNISVELMSYTTLQDIQVFIEAAKPLVVSKDTLDLSNLCK